MIQKLIYSVQMLIWRCPMLKHVLSSKEPPIISIFMRQKETLPKHQICAGNSNTRITHSDHTPISKIFHSTITVAIPRKINQNADIKQKINNRFHVGTKIVCLNFTSLKLTSGVKIKFTSFKTFLMPGFWYFQKFKFLLATEAM